MSKTYFITVRRTKENDYIGWFKKLNIRYTKLPNDDPRHITFIFASTLRQKIRLTILIMKEATL